VSFTAQNYTNGNVKCTTNTNTVTRYHRHRRCGLGAHGLVHGAPGLNVCWVAHWFSVRWVVHAVPTHTPGSFGSWLARRVNTSWVRRVGRHTGPFICTGWYTQVNHERGRLIRTWIYMLVRARRRLGTRGRACRLMCTRASAHAHVQGGTESYMGRRLLGCPHKLGRVGS